MELQSLLPYPRTVRMPHVPVALQRLHHIHPRMVLFSSVPVLQTLDRAASGTKKGMITVILTLIKK